MVLKFSHSTACLAALALAAVAGWGPGCGASPTASGNGGSGSGGQTSSSGGSGGPTLDGSGGASPATGGGSGGMTPSNPNGFDDGKLFADAGAPPPPPAMDASTGGDGSSAAEAGGMGPGVAVKMFPNQGISLSFTQMGADVTMVATHKGCGPFTIQIHGGFSCDNASTQGGVWDGQRGDGITGTVVCNNNIGTLTYTRSGSNPALNWTVGDHNAKTDITYHPIFVDGNCLTFF